MIWTSEHRAMSMAPNFQTWYLILPQFVAKKILCRSYCKLALAMLSTSQRYYSSSVILNYCTYPVAWSTPPKTHCGTAFLKKHSLFERNIEKPSHRPKVRHFDINHADWLLLIPPSCSLLNMWLPPKDFVKFYMKQSLHLRHKQLPAHAGFHPQFWNFTDFTHFCVSPSNYFSNAQ